MGAMIELLEPRQMFSVAIHAAVHPVPRHAPAIHKPLIHRTVQKAQKPAVHAAVTIAPAMMFAGISVDSRDQGSEVLVTITQGGSGCSAAVRVIDADGTINSFTMTGDATGAFTYSGPVGSDIAQVHAQLSADRNSVTGSFTSVRPDGTSNAGTISISRTLVPPTFLVGRGQDQTGKSITLMVVVTPTISGYVAQVRCVNPDETVGGVIITGDASGHFLYDGPDNDGQPLHLDAQLAADGQSATGRFSSANSDGTTQMGTFTLNRT